MKLKTLTLLATLAFSTTLFAQTSGLCGDSLTWTLQDSVLTITGSGTMNNYSYSQSPWYNYRNSIKSIIINSGVTSIGDYSFYDCSILTSVTIPNSVTSIGNYALDGCSGLTSITIPNSVTSIGRWAFAYCRGLTSVTIPISVRSIGYEAFSYCNGLTSVEWNAKNYFDFKNGSGGPFYTIREQITSFIFSDSVEHIPAYLCFSLSSITSISIPNSVMSIGDDAFSGCSGLTSITIPNSVTSIGNYALAGCSGLTSITIPNSVTSIGRRTFANCRGLISVTIPNSVTSIGDNAFYNCISLTSITIPNNITSIGNYAFEGCSALDTIVWNAKGGAAFSPALFNDIRTQISSFTIGDSVQFIPDSLCYGMTNVSSITIPENVTDIGPNTFAGCLSIDSITWKVKAIADFSVSPFNDARDSVFSFTLGDSVKHIPANLCVGMKRLKEFTIPASVESIGDNVFVGCDSLTKVDISNISVWSATDFISSSAEIYINGAKPKKIEIPEGVTRVGAYTFRNCSQVTEVSLPSSVTEIGANAFAYGNRLQTITLDAALETIGDSAFANCPYIITINANMEFPPVINYNVFANCGSLNGIDCYVPQGSLALYKKTAVWQNFNLHEMETGVETIPMDKSDRNSHKIFDNGHLYILLPDGTRFDATGQKMK